jgi:predicted ATP-dependent serine protease
MATCPTCGNKSPGWYKSCDTCSRANTIATTLKSEKKNPLRPIPKQDDE